MQAARRDSVHAPLVFLHLLKGDAQTIRNGGLTQAELLPARQTNMIINAFRISSDGCVIFGIVALFLGRGVGTSLSHS